MIEDVVQKRVDAINKTVDIERMRAEMRWETQKFIIQTVVAVAALLGAGVALGNYFTRASAPPEPVNAAPAASGSRSPHAVMVGGGRSSTAFSRPALKTVDGAPSRTMTIGQV